MAILRNSYVIKQSNGTTWEFSFNEDEGIIYKLYKENNWSEKNVLTSRASKNYSVILFPDDSLNVLYEDLDGMILLNKYNGKQWNENIILTNRNKDIFNIYFKALFYENKIHIIFSILNKQKNTTTLFHQILDEESNVYKLKFIDKIKCNYNVPFILFSSSKQDMLLMYQRFESFYEIGYKIFSIDNQKWSNFRLIDKSLSQFKDYSAVNINGIIYSLYIKREKNLDILNFVHDNYYNFKNTKLFQSPNIENCLILLLCGEVWCFWVKDNRIYSSFSINNGNDFSTFPCENTSNSSDVFKAAYISNNLKEKSLILCNEIFFSNDDSLQPLIFSTLYNNNNNDIKNTTYLSYIQYYMTEISTKIISYEKKLIQKEQLISKLNSQLKEQSEKTISYENEINSINKQYAKFLDLKNQLNENIKLLYQSLVDKEEEINLLEDTNIKNEKEKIALKNKISEEKNKILFLLNELKKANDNFTNIHYYSNKQQKYIPKNSHTY